MGPVQKNQSTSDRGDAPLQLDTHLLMRAIATPWCSAASLRELGMKQALNRAAFNVQPVLLRRALLACYSGPIRRMAPVPPPSEDPWPFEQACDRTDQDCLA